MTSSVAFSNYQNRAFFDPQEQVLSTSNYNVDHRLTLTATWRKALFGDNMTTVSLFGLAVSGQPYSLAVGGNDIFNFTPFLDGNNVLQPGDRRNSENGPSWVKLDMKIEQEIPGFRADDKASAFIVIDNLTNLLNDDWGILDQVSFPNTVDPSNTNATPRVGDASRYEIRFGVKYEF